MAEQVTLREVLSLVKQLSPTDQARLIEEITVEQWHADPKRSLLGAYTDLGPTTSEEDIREVRREM